MVIQVKLNKKVISLQNETFDSKLVYKNAKVALEEEGYIFFEKEHEIKNDQYGQHILFEFQGYKEIDEFCRSTVKIQAKFRNIEKIKIDNKNLQKGDCDVLIIPIAEIDYKNKYGKDRFSEFLFDIYQKYLKKKELEDKYFDVIDLEVVRIYEKIKTSLELYK